MENENELLDLLRSMIEQKKDKSVEEFKKWRNEHK